jgi:hypothetical protein
MNNLRNKIYVAIVATSTIISLTQCKPHSDEQELITTVQLNLTTSPLSSKVYTIQFKDTDGEGGNAPVVTGDTLLADSTYTANVRFLNQSVSPEEDITAEINKEAEEHQVFYQLSAGSDATVTYDDQDANSKPIGVKTKIKTGKAGTNTIKITLRHQPNKDASGVSGGSIANAGGETDVEVSLPFVVK